MFKGFRDFLTKNSVLALAVGFIMGAATGKVVSSLVADAYVFACGPWLGRLFPDVLGPLIKPTRQEVWRHLLNLRKAIESRIDAGARLTYLELATEEGNLQKAAGILEPNDPLVQEWKEIMAENRRRDDECPDVL